MSLRQPYETLVCFCAHNAPLATGNEPTANNVVFKDDVGGFLCFERR